MIRTGLVRLSLGVRRMSTEGSGGMGYQSPARVALRDSQKEKRLWFTSVLGTLMLIWLGVGCWGISDEWRLQNEEGAKALPPDILEVSGATPGVVRSKSQTAKNTPGPKNITLSS
eukprot:gb/GEZN01025720.1/.p1 GENE.gb/GEZN01025720.1/~~gb/GEZN01025720.1/.p1  ORF type:complete len:115 (+),score=4.51 gb/GEZN01025720.1/:86-430(+)